MFSQQENGATEDVRSVKAICEQRFIRLEVLNRALSTLLPEHAGKSALSRIIELLPDASQELQLNFLLLPELVVWISGLEHQMETWVSLPSRRLSLSRHLDYLRTLALPILMAVQKKTVVAIRIPATSILVLPSPGVSITFPTSMAGNLVDAEGDNQWVWFEPGGCRVPWTAHPKEPAATRIRENGKAQLQVAYHAQLVGQITVRSSCHWDRMPGNRPLIHGSRAVEQPTLPTELVEAWKEVRREVLDAGITDQVLARSIRVVIVDPLDAGHSEGIARIHPDVSRKEAHDEIRDALSETFSLVSHSDSSPKKDLPLIELRYFHQIETALKRGGQELHKLLTDWRADGDPFRLGCASMYLEEYAGAAEAFRRASQQNFQPERAWQLYCLCLRHQGCVESFEHLFFTGRPLT
jgi:hypothetical protein